MPRRILRAFAFWGLVAAAAIPVRAQESPRFVDAERELVARFGPRLADVPPAEIAHSLVRMAECLPVGGAIHLPQSVPCGRLDFRRVADDVQITGGHGGTLVLGGGQQGIRLLFSKVDQSIEEGLDRPFAAHRPVVVAAQKFKDEQIFTPKTAPATDLFAMFCEGSIHVKSDVDRCVWIAGANAFGSKTVTADARVDNSLFLWFGVNWPFADYNGHFNPKFKDRDWLRNSQLWFDCKGGGQGTRLYLMVETNYGNPGPGVVLHNCKGMSLYHGSTERASSQGPGVYWLKNCEDVKVGLRRVFSATRQGQRSAQPSHDVTIEGGKGNVLHNIEFFGNPQLESAVNSDPELQAWSTSFDYETKGFDGPRNLRFAFTPELNRPLGADLEAVKAKLPKLIEEKLKYSYLDSTDDNKKRLEEKFLSGRDAWHPLNARKEVTFVYGNDDLTKGIAKLANGQKLPAPPSIPATDAPRFQGEVAFTQQPDFGKALLDAGADPTGKRPSDDAFAKVMFGMTRDEVQSLLNETYQADAAFRTARKAKDDDAMKKAKARLSDAMAKLHPAEPNQKPGQKARFIKRPMLQIPTGEFLLTRPLVLVGGWNNVWGTGPKKTILKARGDFKVIEQHQPGTLANFTVDGGRVGLAITGSDHEDGVSPTLHSYVAGSNYFRLTFRNQTFAGIHIGRDDPDAMGGAEHDQNRYVEIVFENTGLYGIYVNANMLDKWLLLHSDFVGQSKAGISVKFNNLIHGMVASCTFKNIDGPGIDFMGGNPEIQFRPHQVWIEQCDFLECGNAQQPAVDEGAGVCAAITRCRIVTKNKIIKTGYRGGAAIYEDLAIDVQTAANDPAILLRASRHNQTSRPNGHMLRNVRANGPVGFVNDANAYNDLYTKTMQQRGKNTNLKWDTNPAANELAPMNGWIHPYVFYQCRFGDASYAYDLLNVDVDKGRILRAVDLSPLAKSLSPAPSRTP